VDGLGRYAMLGATIDDAAGEAFDKTAKLLGLGYPGGPALAKLAETGDARRFNLPRPMLASGDFNFSFSGLKTAAVTLFNQHRDTLGEQGRADLAAAAQEAIVEVLVTKSLAAVEMCGVRRLVVAGGVGANKRLRELMSARGERQQVEVFYPPLEFCTDNGAMIALVAALKLERDDVGKGNAGFSVRPRWDLVA
jgi:N6-L-threonylcarbamoyladenine synthase